MSLQLEGVRPHRRRRGLARRDRPQLGSQGLYVLLGPTLAGKTSLMRLMAGLDRPTEGRVLVDGLDVTGMACASAASPWSTSSSSTIRRSPAFENIASPLRLAGRPPADIDRRVRDDRARLLHIDHLLDRARRPSSRAASSSAPRSPGRWSRTRGLLLLDEPLVNLDYKLREELRAELRDLFARRDAIVVYATTEPLEALLMGGQVVVLDEGRVLQAGPTLEVYHRPAIDRGGAASSATRR